MKAYVKGKNLLPYPYLHTTKTQYGITFTDNGDGSVTANGTATEEAGTAGARFAFVNKVVNGIKAGRYTFSTGTNILTPLVIYDGTTNKILYDTAISSSGRVTLNITAESVRVWWFIRVRAGEIIDTTFYPMIEEGTAATTYEPYAVPEEITIPKSVEVNGEEVALRFAKIDDYADKLVVDVTNQKVTYTQNIFYFKCSKITTFQDRSREEITNFTDDRRWFQVESGSGFPHFIPGKGLCTILHQTSSDYGDYNHLRISNYSTYGLIGFILQGFKSDFDFKEYTLSHDVIVQAPLETPVEYDLTDTKLGQKLLTIVKNNKGYVGAKYYTANPDDKSELIAVECNDAVTLSSTSMEIQGNTEQQIYEGKNLVDIDKMVNDCLVKNSDGSFTLSKISGFADRFSGKFYVNLPAGTYYASCIIIDKTTRSLQIRAQYTDGTYSGNFILPDTKVTFDKQVEYLQLFISYDSIVGQYYTFKDFMLEEGTTATDYEPYVGGVPIPNPEQPQDIVNIGDHRLKVAINSVKRKKMAIYMHGKNLIDISKLQCTVPEGGTFTNNGDGSIVVNSFYALSTKPLSYCAPSLKAGNTYSLSLKTEGTNTLIYLRDSKSYWWSGTSRTLTHDDIKSRFYVYGANGKAITSWNYQIEEGSVVTKYEPYNSKNLIDVFNRTEGTLSGSANTTIRNFEFDKYYVGLTANNYYYAHLASNEAIKENGWEYTVNQSEYGVTFPVKCKPNTTYTLSYIESNENARINVGYYTKNGEYLNYRYNTQSKPSFSRLSTPDNCEIMTICLTGNKSETPYLIQNIMLEQGDTPTPYEPYGRKRHKVKIIRSGKNLWDYKAAMIAAGGVLQEDGSVYLSSPGLINNGKVIWYPQDDTKQITITATIKHYSLNGAGINSATTYPAIKYTDGTLLSGVKIWAADAYQKYHTASIVSDPNKTIESVVWGFQYGGGIYIKDVQIEYGDTATEYEPFKIV